MTGATGESLAAPPSESLTLAQCLQRTIDRNTAVQAQVLDWMASWRLAEAARGIFEPDFAMSIEHLKSSRLTTAQQKASLSTNQFDESNTYYSEGVEVLAPTGGRLRLGYDLRDLSNNLQPHYSDVDREFESFAGLRLQQPLLKNGGMAATLADLRLAAGESELAFQEYRRQLSLIVARTELAYWDLFLGQEQLAISRDSLKIAEQLLQDNRMRITAGKASELDVLQAEAGVALRQAHCQEAGQKRVDAQNRLHALFADEISHNRSSLQAIDHPAIYEGPADYVSSMQELVELNPDYLTQRRRLIQENIRLAYARNQRWPQLDLKASLGLNGLGDTPGESWDDIGSGQHETWSVGMELRIPLGGGIKARNELAAVKLRKQKALMGLKNVETELGNNLDTVLQHMASSRQSVSNYRQIAAFNQKVLDTELVRLEAGRSDSRKVLEAEQALSEARRIAAAGLVDHQRACLEWELTKGTILRSRKLELSQAQLRIKSGPLETGGEWSRYGFDRFNHPEFSPSIMTNRVGP